ncbi:MAG: hypothetical protein EBT67_10340 [Betaproteobacteria bacterium]|nr:hypothetical protein [Betaproteobacteria bacterium]
MCKNTNEFECIGMNFLKSVLLTLLVLAAPLQSAKALEVARSDMLLHIVEECTNTQKPGYCEKCLAPQRQAMCVMRDIKMCGCPKQFVHGLVLPKARVTGIEDPKRTEAIWQFAWDIARQRLDTNEIALAVNPPSRRSQNQLHVHLVRLKPGINTDSFGNVTVRTQNLTNVWAVASESALKHQLKEYGLLVTSDQQGGYLVVLTQDSPEMLYTQAYCTP